MNARNGIGHGSFAFALDIRKRVDRVPRAKLKRNAGKTLDCDVKFRNAGRLPCFTIAGTRKRAAHTVLHSERIEHPRDGQPIMRRFGGCHYAVSKV